jgi:hypothetical protein
MSEPITQQPPTSAAPNIGTVLEDVVKALEVLSGKIDKLLQAPPVAAPVAAPPAADPFAFLAALAADYVAVKAATAKK